MNKNSPEQPILKLYQLISGPAEHERPWDEISSLFLPGARIRMEVEEEKEAVRSADWSIDEFARDAGAHYRRAGFWENEISRRMDRFGNVAHIFSTYESRVDNPESPPVARGINSIQVLKREGSWRIASIIFHIEQPDVPIPAEYLQSEV
jgi:hypothetical protein